MEKKLDEERKLQEALASAREEERRKLKDQIVGGKQTSVLDNVAPVIQAVVMFAHGIYSMLSSTDSDDD